MRAWRLSKDAEQWQLRHSKLRIISDTFFTILDFVYTAPLSEFLWKLDTQ